MQKMPINHYEIRNARVTGHTLDAEPHARMGIDGDEVSDSYHSMTELYNHRHALFCALVKVYDNYKTPLGSHVVCWKSKLHSDGTMFDDFFIVGMTIHKLDTTVEYITYHIPIEWWDKFKVMQYETAPLFDGHTSDDVIERLLGL